MQRQVPYLAALAGHPQMRHAFALVPQILDLELAQLLAPRAWNSSVERMALSRLLLIGPGRTGWSPGQLRLAVLVSQARGRGPVSIRDRGG
jgi:hypothetical protein